MELGKAERERQAQAPVSWRPPIAREPEEDDDEDEDEQEEDEDVLKQDETVRHNAETMTAWLQDMLQRRQTGEASGWSARLVHLGSSRRHRQGRVL